MVKALAEVEDAPDAVRNLVYTGNAQKLVTPGTAKNGTMVYSLDNKTIARQFPLPPMPIPTPSGTKVVATTAIAIPQQRASLVTIKKAPLTVTAE